MRLDTTKDFSWIYDDLGVLVNKKHLSGTVPANKEHLTGTVPVNKEHLTGTLLNVRRCWLAMPQVFNIQEINLLLFF